MIKKVANNETNQEPMNLEPTKKIIEKLKKNSWAKTTPCYNKKR